MNPDEECFYCSKDHQLHELMREVCCLNKSTVYLFNDQNYKGRCVVAYNKHLTELYQLIPSELHEYMDEVAKVAEVIHKIFNPDKISYAIFGDNVSHIHYHIVPKYKKGPLWGEFFCSKILPVKQLPESEFEELRRVIRDNLK